MNQEERTAWIDELARKAGRPMDDFDAEGFPQQDEPFSQAAPAVQLLNFEEWRRSLNHGGGAMLIKGLIQVGTLISVNSRPNLGKTAFMIELARILDAGEPFLGRETRKAAVLYIAAEDADDVGNRLEAVGLKDVQIVYSPDGVPLLEPAKAVAIVREAIRLGREKFPDRELFIPFDTLRAGLGDGSVLDDRLTSPALNALRALAEKERVVIAICNHTNRENPKQSKGETLEAVVATEFIMLEGDGNWMELWIGKNRSGPRNRQIGRYRMTSAELANDVTAALIDEMQAVDGDGSQEKERKHGASQALILRLMSTAILDHGFDHCPFIDGPKVKAVKESILKDRFVEAKAGDNRHGKQRSFDAAMNGLLSRQELARGENDNKEGLIWYAKNKGQGDDFLAA